MVQYSKADRFGLQGVSEFSFIFSCIYLRAEINDS